MRHTRKGSRPGNAYMRRAPFIRANLLSLPVAAFALCLCISVVALADSSSQSGRRQTKPASPVPTPAPEAQEESESESRPKRSLPEAHFIFSVSQSDNAFPYVDLSVQEHVLNEFVARLRRARDASVSSGDRKLTRKEAHDLAKAEQDAFIILLELEEDSFGMTGGGRASPAGRGDPRLLAIKTYIYEPRTGALKFTDHTSQRPYRESATIGGVRLPMPTSRSRIERFPGELTLEQAAHDAADRVMRRFNIPLPPRN